MPLLKLSSETFAEMLMDMYFNIATKRSFDRMVLYDGKLLPGGCRCFRDEDQRADRQPEFTQLDLEMSFVKGEQVMEVIEGILRRLWQDMLGETIPSPFPRMSYHNAMAK